MENAIKGYNHQGPHPWIDICADYTRMIDNKDIFFIPFRDGPRGNGSGLCEVLTEISAPAFPLVNNPQTKQKRDGCTDSCHLPCPSLVNPAFNLFKNTSKSRRQYICHKKQKQRRIQSCSIQIHEILIHSKSPVKLFQDILLFFTSSPKWHSLLSWRHFFSFPHR